IVPSRLSRWQAPGLASTEAGASPIITSIAPPNGTVGEQYGPPTTEAYKCFFLPFLGHQVCSPCSSLASCFSLPRCAGLGPSPCVKFEIFHFGFVLTASGGQSPYFWSVFGLPPGLTINSQKGDISGTPTVPGNYHLTVTVADSSSPPLHSTTSYSIT